MEREVNDRDLYRCLDVWVLSKENMDLETKETWVRLSPPTSCVTLDMLLNSSGPQLPYL